ncbi:MAG: glycosyltransferase family 4 protein [Ottowia sp.]|uniref:glycosyltransferase family 4 protein n=1 Tax=Ottowia sp. TaxID=1898956 RepID=UPI003C75D532
MERLNWHIADELSRRAHVHVIGPVGAAALQPENVTLTEAPLRPLSRFLLTSTWQAARLARSWRPEIVLAGSGLTAPAALLAARIAKARAHVYLHGLDAAVKHPVYQAVWHPAIRQMDGVITNSQPTTALAQALGVDTSRIRIVHPGVQMPAEPRHAEDLEAFRQRYGLGNARLLLSVGRLAERKGLREFVEFALPDIVRQAPDALLAIVGDAPADALHANEQTQASIQAIADASSIGKHLRFLGRLSENDLACAYESASLHIFPVRQLPNDPEGFGMVAIEAAAHGIPTVAFASGGIVDAVKQGKSGHLVPPGDYAALTQAVLQVLSTPPGSWRDTTYNFAQQFAWPTFGDTLYAALTSPSS